MAAAAGRDVCGALLTWLQTFAPPWPCASPQDLANGVVLAYVLHSIDPSWFNETWLGLIREDAGDNWRLKVRNLRQVLQRLLEYWQEVLGRAVAERHVPDVGLAAVGAEPQELGRMGRLLLGCAVSGAGGAEHIQRILALEEPVRRLLLLEIQELLGKEAPGVMDESEEQLCSYCFLSTGPGQRCRELRVQVSALRGERSRLAEENRALREENDRLEAGCEELRVRCRRLEREARALRALSPRSGRLEAAAAAFRGREPMRAQAGSARLQAARRQVEELSGQRAERWQREVRCLRERYRELREEKERLQEERDALLEANEELRCAQLQQSLRQADGAFTGSLAAEIIPAELRDMVMRLQRENRRLQERLEAAGVTPLHSTQGDSQAEFLLLDETIDNLDELQWDEDLDPHKDSTGSQCVTGLQQRRWGHSGGGDWSPPLRTHWVLDPPLTPELQTLQNQVQEKEALIQHLEGDWERSRAQREREERLLVTAWYNLGLVLQQQEEGGAPSSLAQRPPTP